VPVIASGFIVKLKWFSVVGVATVALVLAAFYWRSTGVNQHFIDPLADKARVELGKVLYANHCAACHGANLQGQPNWRDRMANGRLPAPPHDKTGHTWHHPDPLLVDMIKNGLVPGRTAPPGYESDMPAYDGVLSDDEIIAIIAYIKSTWPPGVLKAQKEATLRTGSR
jgi:mono/diheme cytochrome c family protein